MGAVHAHEANFRVTCGIASCPRSFTNFHTYKSHLYKRHREILQVSESAAQELVGSEDGTDLTVMEAEEMSPQHEKKEMALFVLKALAISKISNSALDTILSDISFLLETRVQSLHDDVSAVMGIELDAELAAIFQRPQLYKPFDGLQTDYLRKTYFTNEMGLLVSLKCLVKCLVTNCL